MRFLFFGLVAICVAAIISNGLRRDGDAKLEMHRAEQQAKLDQEQRQILASLEAINSKTVSTFVADWRQHRSEVTEKSLEELRIIQEKIRNDPASAEKFTLAARQEAADKFNAAISSPFGAKMDAKPGL